MGDRKEGFNVVYYHDYDDEFYYKMLLASLTSIYRHHDAFSFNAYLVCNTGMTVPSPIMNMLSGIYYIDLDPGYYTRNKHRGYADINLPGNTLYIDTDTIFHQNISSVFEDHSWWIAVAERHIPIKGIEFNSGVVFCRIPAFWDELSKADIHYKAMMVETFFSSLVRQDKYRPLRVLPASYNWDPSTKTEDVSMHHIVHYKGNRKPWMPLEN